jgi:hypothetical protein
MTPKEAAAVNALFGFLTGIDREIPAVVAQAMETLASRAHNRLQSGVDENAVRAQWPAAFTSD